ncbi:MAG: MDR family MFS transporter [Desulfoprunum sp.]
MVTATVMLGTMMNAIDTSIVNVALPYMRGGLGASIEEIARVSTGFILANVIIMPIIALLSARFGRRRFYFVSVLLFTVSSVLCGLARSLDLLILARVLQGIGGGAITPLSQAILRESFEPEEQGMAMGIFGLGVILGPAFGPTLGGWLSDHYSWPWIFYINIPFGIVNLFMILRYLEDPPYLVRERQKIDWPGLAFMVAGLGALQLMLEQGQDKDWFNSDFIVGLAAIAVVGLVIMPRALAMAVAMPLGGRLYNSIGPRPLIVAGLAVSAAAFWQMTSPSLNTNPASLLVPMIFQGFGLGLAFVAASTAAMGNLDRAQMTAASGLYNVIRQVCGSFGIALSATLLTRGYITNRTYLMEYVAALDGTSAVWLEQLQRYLAGRGADAVSAKSQALGLLARFVDQQAYMLSYNRVYVFVSLLFVLTIPLVAVLRPAAEERPGK